MYIEHSIEYFIVFISANIDNSVLFRTTIAIYNKLHFKHNIQSLIELFQV